MLFEALKKSTTPNRRRVGRGIAAGQGKTAGRGTKGQGSRSGYRTKPSFEGGQTPLVQRLPKLKGFKSRRAQAYFVKTADLAKVDGKQVNTESLQKAGLLPVSVNRVKIIAGGELKVPKTVEVQSVSKTAESLILAAGGTVKIVEVVKALPKNSKPKKIDKKD